MAPESEFAFELCVCDWAERRWPPTGPRDGPVIVARQLGTQYRRWDTVVIECDPDGVRARADFGADPINSDLLYVLRDAPSSWTFYRDALPDPGYPWRYVRESIHEAADRGLIEERKVGNRIEIRRKRVYPDWVERIVAIENKPDLTASAARDLAPQLERDLALGLADEVWVATAATGDRVEPILLEAFPVEAGVLTVDAEAGTAEATWQPRTLAVDEPGTRILENPTGPNAGLDAARFEYADPEWKREKRLAIAERAYGRGWRGYADTMRTDCRHFEMRDERSCIRPHCGAKERTPTPWECSASCPAVEPEPPIWRTRGWPIEGGPGKGIEMLLDRQRRRQRPGLD